MSRGFTEKKKLYMKNPSKLGIIQLGTHCLISGEILIYLCSKRLCTVKTYKKKKNIFTPVTGGEYCTFSAYKCLVGVTVNSLLIGD